MFVRWLHHVRCEAYLRTSHYCATYGGHQFRPGVGTANAHCCACGGGRRLRFAVGDRVEVRQYIYSALMGPYVDTVGSPRETRGLSLGTQRL